MCVTLLQSDILWGNSRPLGVMFSNVAPFGKSLDTPALESGFTVGQCCSCLHRILYDDARCVQVRR